MRVNKSIMPRSREVYCKVIHKLLLKDEDLTVENLNRFITESAYHSKFALKHYLDFMKRSDLYPKLKKMVPKERRNIGVYVPKESILSMIRRIRKKQFRGVAYVQFTTGSRATETLAIKKGKVRAESKGLHITLFAKGGKERKVIVPDKYSHDIRDLVENTEKDSQFIFIREVPGRTPEQMLENNYKYYYEMIRKVAEKEGILGFRTHDFRRNLINDLAESGYSIQDIKEIIGHSSIMTTANYIPVNREKIEDAILELRG